VSFPTVKGRAVEGLLFREARSDLGPSFGSSVYKFFLTGTSTPANVYQDGALTNPFTSGGTGVVTADAFGRFPAIYLDTSVIYKVQFFNASAVLQWTVAAYTPLLSTVGTSSLSAFGMNIATTGEVTIPAPNSGGSGISLTLKAGSLGSAALQVSAQLPGNSAIIINSSLGTGAQTAVFAANNKPGTVGSVQLTLTVAPTGATYTGGTLTASFTGTTSSLYGVTLSTGQNITGVTLTNGSTTFTTPSTSISGTPTATFNVAPGPAGWLPITGDSGVQYYIPIWHGNSFTPYTANPTAVGEVINSVTVTFGGTGLTTAGGGTAVPGNWFTPVATGVGAGYYINITKTGGLSGLSFVEQNMVASTVAPSGATYTGGTLTAAYAGNTASNYTLQLSTGQLITGCTFTNGSATFTTPSTSITGTPNNVLAVTVQGVWVNITANGVTITSNAQAAVSGTYQLSSSSSGTPVVASGTISLSGNNGVQSPTINGVANLVLAGNGTATLNGVSTSSWFAPTATNIGQDFYILITPTGGTTGYSFSAATGAYTNITASGLAIAINGSGATTSIPSVTGTYVIASDTAGVQQLGAGTITITGSVTHTYTGTSGTETAPTGASFVTIKLQSGGGEGFTSGSSGYGGSGGGQAVTGPIPITGGQTLAYALAGGQFQLNGNASGFAGGNGSVTSGTKTITTMSVVGGGGGNVGSAGAVGTASGGTISNTSGSVGLSSGTGGAGGDGSTGGAPGSAGSTPCAGVGRAIAGTLPSQPATVSFIYT